MPDDKTQQAESEAMAQLQLMTADQVRKIVREELAHFMMQSKFVFNRPIQVMDGNDIVLGQTNGTRLGTSATQKLGLYGKTPVAQQSAITPPNIQLATYHQSDAETLRSAIDDIINRLQVLGITA
jgi:hypothetical protein